MERKDFIKGLGVIGIGSLLPVNKAEAFRKVAKAQTCTLVPSETAGPYPLNLSSNAAMFRTDIRETQDGVDTLVTLRIVGANNCGAMQNCRVDLWHCNAYGYYSGYTTSGQNGSQNHVGETFLRGIQMTDVNGEVQFLTKFPGWYSGRVTHIHFQVFLSSVLQVTSQLTFPIADKNALYAAHLPYSNYGPDPSSPATDMVFSDGYALQLSTLTFNSSTGQYECFLEATINGSGTTGLQNLEPETGGQFKLGLIYPNPFRDVATIPFNLKNASHVKIEIFDMTAKKLLTLVDEKMNAGDQKVVLNRQNSKGALPQGNYVYQLTVENENGIFSQCKVMTVR